MKKFKTLLILSLISMMTSCGSTNGSLPNGEVSVSTPTSITSNYSGTYYNSVDFNLTKADLKTALFNVISKNTTSLSYSALWSAFKDTDAKSDGTVWDMYSNIRWTFSTNQCGNYQGEGNCYNREHSIPKSWFNEASPMYTDLFHLYPTDGYVNSRRSNYPFGEVKSASYTSKNGSKLGSSSHSLYSGTVFEPIDEYKGDFARTYFYFATRYQDKTINLSEGSKVFVSASYPKLTNYSIDLFKKWSKNDPVSQKEINRNNAVYKKQKNRNPFIDYPLLEDKIW